MPRYIAREINPDTLPGEWLAFDTSVNWPVSFNPAGHRRGAVERYVAQLNTDYDAWMASKPDPRDPDPSREGIFRDHNCSRCKNGADLSKCPTPERPGNCGYPHARND